MGSFLTLDSPLSVAIEVLTVSAFLEWALAICVFLGICPFCLKFRVYEYPSVHTAPCPSVICSVCSDVTSQL